MTFRKTIIVRICGREFEETWELELRFTPGEKAVHYTANGDGYPGSPPEVELISAELRGRTGDEGEVDFEPMRLSSPDWAARAGIRTAKDWELFDAWAFAKAAEEQEAAYDDACEHEMEAAREEGRPPRRIRRRR